MGQSLPETRGSQIRLFSSIAIDINHVIVSPLHPGNAIYGSRRQSIQSLFKRRGLNTPYFPVGIRALFPGGSYSVHYMGDVSPDWAWTSPSGSGIIPAITIPDWSKFEGSISPSPNHLRHPNVTKRGDQMAKLKRRGRNGFGWQKCAIRSLSNRDRERRRVFPWRHHHAPAPNDL